MLIALLCGALSGLALFFSGPPGKKWPLVLVGLLPWTFALETMSPVAALISGLALAVFYLVPMLRVLQFPLVMGAGMGIWQGGLWLLSSYLGHAILANPAGGAPIVFACAVTLISWLDYTIVPAFGTAQCFARVLTRGPRLIQFARVTGMPGLAFVTVALQALVVRLLVHPGWTTASMLISLMIAVGLFNEFIWRLPSVGTLKIAAMGWADPQQNHALIQSVFPQYLAEAREAGAQLVVSPEAQFAVENRVLWLQQMSAFAVNYNLNLAVGFFDMKRDDNRIAFLAPNGDLKGEYAKTHLVPFFENYKAGNGARARVSLEEWNLGGVICQDDNFTDIARGYGRDGAHILAVPTHDWRLVKDFHYENCRLRAIECGFGIVRAASHGVSAIISPRGEILRQLDHYRGGSGLITANMPLRSGVTLYARLGDWLVFVCAAAVVAWVLIPS